MATSFKKKTTTRGRPPLPVGTKPSLNNNQLLISTGIPSLDNLIGGGLAVGTLLMIEEDIHASYTNVLQKMFLGEAVVCSHCIYLACLEKDAEVFLQEVPCTVEEAQQANKEKETINKSDLQIAWRYQNKPTVESSGPKFSFGHYFDLSQQISEEKLEKINYKCFCPTQSNFKKNRQKSEVNSKYKELLIDIKAKIKEEKLYTENCTSTPSILRISLCSLGSTSWNEGLINTDEYDHSLAWFLLALRSLLRASLSVCMVSIPTHLFEHTPYISRLRHCCDTVIRLETFPDFQQNPLIKEYHGFFRVEKLSSLNSINGQNIDTSDLAFKLKRKKFIIEKFHLPPDISETASRSQGNTPTKISKPLCSVSTPINDLLDF